jgi:hypothetical protein
MRIAKTRHGLRLSQHGVVISELRTSPGPTHSVFDVLAALIAELAPAPLGRVGVLGFAGGGMMAPLRGLGCLTRIESCDLDRSAFDLFRKHCAGWLPQVSWHHADAVRWLQQQPGDFALLMDDLSIARDGDVLKPDVSWETLPALIKARLRPGGHAVFNLLPPRQGRWGREVVRLGAFFSSAQVIHLDEFENRILVAGAKLPPARLLSARLRKALGQLGSRQAARIHVQAFAKNTSSRRAAGSRRVGRLPALKPIRRRHRRRV